MILIKTPNLKKYYKQCHKSYACCTVKNMIAIIHGSNQSILKEIYPEYSLEGQMPKLKLQYFGHLMRTVDSLGKTLKMGKIEGRRRRGDRG